MYWSSCSMYSVEVYNHDKNHYAIDLFVHRWPVGRDPLIYKH